MSLMTLSDHIKFNIVMNVDIRDFRPENTQNKWFWKNRITSKTSLIKIYLLFIKNKQITTKFHQKDCFFFNHKLNYKWTWKFDREKRIKKH